MNKLRILRIAARLALRDWLHDGLLTVCGVLALVSVLTPLLILLGIRNGVVASLQTRLLENPSLLTVTPTGSGNGYTREWLETLAARTDVTFVIPKTRDISTSVQMQATRFAAVDVEPTAAGDPLLVRYAIAAPDRTQLVLTRQAADRLGVDVGGSITARLGRTSGVGKMESVPLTFTVSAILPLEAESRALAFAPLAVLEDMENYKDGYAVADWNVPGEPVPDVARRYARFRLYVRTMDDVAVLRNVLTTQGIEVQTSALEIRSFQEINRAMTILFVIIAVTVAAGFMASTVSSVLAAVRRKDKHLAMLRLFGFSGGGIILFPLVQAQLTAVTGSVLALAVYVAAGAGLDALFAGQFQGAAVSLLPPVHAGLIVLGVCAAALCASLPAARRAARIEPSDVLRTL